ncbi:MAG: hypothetical protein K8S97_07620, partial [Anaerolineae bacterium]|nr:hypothetical protein [Anaerolineae bacterium]
AVVAEARYSGGCILITAVLVAGSFAMGFGPAFAPALGFTQFTQREAVLLVLLATALIGGALTLLWAWATWQIRGMFGVLHEVLTPFDEGRFSRSDVLQ